MFLGDYYCFRGDSHVMLGLALLLRISMQQQATFLGEISYLSLNEFQLKTQKQ